MHIGMHTHRIPIHDYHNIMISFSSHDYIILYNKQIYCHYSMLHDLLGIYILQGIDKRTFALRFRFNYVTKTITIRHVIPWIHSAGIACSDHSELNNMIGYKCTSSKNGCQGYFLQYLFRGLIDLLILTPCYVKDKPWHTEAKTKWSPFCKWYFPMHFLEWKGMDYDCDFTGVYSN